LYSSQDHIVDFSFIGLGASNSLIILDLLKKGLLSNFKVAVFESTTKSKNDKTYCFWSDTKATIVQDLSPIIRHRFDHIIINESKRQDISDQPYYYIRSIDLYDYTKAMLAEAGIEVYRISVDSLSYHENGCSIVTKQQTFLSRFVFDSRPPKIKINPNRDVYIHQSFFGLHVKFVNSTFPENAFEMMNFSVEQNGYTQFVYIIPFSSNEALIELTRFGADRIETSYANEILDGFILQNFGNYEVLADEMGCIPMTTWENPPHHNHAVLNTGTSANLIKPSTGYGFKNMYNFSQLVTQRFESNDFSGFNKIAAQRKIRFKFYDRLLLMILLRWPAKGAMIFKKLFGNSHVRDVFTFLDEKTTWKQEVKIFAVLPFAPFLKAIYFLLQNKGLLRYLLVLLVVVLYTLLNANDEVLALYFSYSVIAIGLLMVGIPHGALDHMLSFRRDQRLYLFLLKYLSIVMIYFAFWQLYPTIALLVFIAYSSFHFGESEWVQFQKQTASFSDYVSAFLVGLSILSFIIFSHWHESLPIISYFSQTSLLIYDGVDALKWTNMFAALSLFYLLMISWFLRSWGLMSLVFVLILGVQLPLVLAFGLYFIFQHSLNAWLHLKSGLQLRSMDLYKKSSLFTFGAIVLFMLMVCRMGYPDSDEVLWANFFVFLACISLPHFLMMHLFYRSRVSSQKSK
jgi:lycopene beta-cyclase